VTGRCCARRLEPELAPLLRRKRHPRTSIDRSPTTIAQGLSLRYLALPERRRVETSVASAQRAVAADGRFAPAAEQQALNGTASR
jgi:hypothetical protein